MDGGSIYNQKTFGEIKSIAEGNNIHYQIRKSHQEAMMLVHM